MSSVETYSKDEVNPGLDTSTLYSLSGSARVHSHVEHRRCDGVRLLVQASSDWRLWRGQVLSFATIC